MVMKHRMVRMKQFIRGKEEMVEITSSSTLTEDGRAELVTKIFVIHLLFIGKAQMSS